MHAHTLDGGDNNAVRNTNPVTTAACILKRRLADCVARPSPPTSTRRAAGPTNRCAQTPVRDDGERCEVGGTATRAAPRVATPPPPSTTGSFSPERAEGEPPSEERCAQGACEATAGGEVSQREDKCDVDGAAQDTVAPFRTVLHRLEHHARVQSALHDGLVLRTDWDV